MHITERSRRLLRRASLMLGTIACVVLLGWVTGLAPLVQVLPSFPATQFNSALGILGCALALHSLARGRPRLVAVGATVAALLGVFTLLQYIFQVELGIDRLILHEPAIPGPVPLLPGRMAASTAMLLLLAGTVLAAWPFLRPQAFGEAVVGSIGITTGAIAGITFLSYASGLLSSLRFGTITGMGIPTTI
ncbi:MAG TPA: hypothetical protein VFX50_12330, partial [Gemmatimonadales bacterium]|nr:hypothetical protein [Gemmatimonadales bacterium]